MDSSKKNSKARPGERLVAGMKRDFSCGRLGHFQKIGR
ncbi:Hypothetical protein Minf_0046 [Methylacidiphilum infernorum V4]|uniref:Uncharacterized protein n=1 Tax=Methylacidiphilum infernorum (isolate V4) TaxID=481448 RepID=B3DWW6_METI4|nr:Hypothetical protein Minf_0046 [Methylacidiphilum infernorum V4]